MTRQPVMLLFAGLLALQVGSAQQARGDDGWFRREKVRCISYLDASEFMVASVPRVREMGFNCALVQWGGTPVEGLLPLIRAADEAGLHLVMVTYFKTDDYLKTSGDQRRFVGADGLVIPVAPCPTDARYWQTLLAAPALGLAKLRAQGHASISGVLFDMEDYPNLRDTAMGPMRYCYCDECFGAFAKSIGKEGLALAPAERRPWLVEQGLLDAYQGFQNDAVVALLAGIRGQLDAAAPGLMLASYPWLYVSPAERKSRIDWDMRFARGLGTQSAPFMLLTEDTYIWGYRPEMERQQADYAAQGLPFLAVTGFNLVPAERVWYPRQMVDSAYYACRRSDGYWFFLGTMPLLQVAAGQNMSYVFGGRPEQWVADFTVLNQAVTTGQELATQPLTLPPIGDHWTLSELYDLKRAPDAQAWVRPWADIGLPWEEGELVMVGGKEGDWMSFACRMGRPDNEEIIAWLTTGPDRAIAQLYVDDQPVGEPVDLYSSVTIPGDRVALGRMFLTRGNHTYKFAAAGKNERASGYSIGLRALWTEDIGYPPPTWSVIAPFDNTGEEAPGYDVVYPPEREINLEAVYEGKRGEKVRWREVSADPDGYLDLLSAFDERDAAAYCLTYVYSSTDGPRTLLFGSGDGGKLWLNGEFLWGDPSGRSPERDRNRARVNLRRGWNEVLVKVLRAHGAWGLYLRFYDPERELKYSPAPAE